MGKGPHASTPWSPAVTIEFREVLRSMRMAKAWYDEDERTIVINPAYWETADLWEKRWALCHELAHHLCDHGPQSGLGPEQAKQLRDREEGEAEQFALSIVAVDDLGARLVRAGIISEEIGALLDELWPLPSPTQAIRRNLLARAQRGRYLLYERLGRMSAKALSRVPAAE
jgi:hypothetical protein